MPKAWFKTVATMTEELVSIASISPDDEGENKCARKICEFLIGKGEGKTSLRPELWPTGDGRFSVLCQISGDLPNNGETVIVVGHFDTVDVDDIHMRVPGVSDDIAFHRELRTFFEDDPTLPDDVKNDLDERVVLGEESLSAWLFGRGAFDMKSGIAAVIAVVRELWKERANLRGHVLFVACPDEENESRGIITAVDRLRQLRSEQNLQYVGVINADYTTNRCDDLSRRFVYDGTVGKLLPSFYVLGESTHVGEPFRGVGAGQIAAELVHRINLNPELSDTWRNNDGMEEVAMPPTVLHCRDLKSQYNVKTISEAFLYFNWLTYTLTPQRAMKSMVGQACAALDSVLEHRQRYFECFKGQAPDIERYEVQVLSFSSLCAKVRANRGWDQKPEDPRDDPLTVWLEEVARAEGNGKDARDISLHVVREAVRSSGLKGPAIIVFFSPPYYSHIKPGKSRVSNAVRTVLRQLKGQDSNGGSSLREKFLAAVERPADPPIEIRGFYPYISDLSFLGLDTDVADTLQDLKDNMPLFRRGYWLDFHSFADLGCGVINIGPYGRDAHGVYERVHKPYSFEVVPQLIYETLKEMLR